MTEGNLQVELLMMVHQYFHHYYYYMLEKILHLNECQHPINQNKT
jgi:hypothetical protein